MDDLSFFINIDGKEIKCHIVSMINGENSDETYVAFIDGEIEDKNKSLQYAKIIKNNDEYIFEPFENEEMCESLSKKIIDNLIDESSALIGGEHE